MLTNDQAIKVQSFIRSHAVPCQCVCPLRPEIRLYIIVVPDSGGTVPPERPLARARHARTLHPYEKKRIWQFDAIGDDAMPEQ